MRGMFALSETAIQNLVQNATRDCPRKHAISTCNRMELYGFATEANDLIKLICEHSHGTVEEFSQHRLHS
jgi:glutamyl-tRNA reductase